jgi:hypothetical protein
VQSVSNWVTAAGLSTRDRATAHALAVDRGLGRFRGRAVYDQVEVLYREGKGTTAIARELDLPAAFVFGVIERAGIMRSVKESQMLAAEDTSRRKRRYAVNEAAFDGDLDAPLAWALGVIYGDGWISRVFGVERGVGVCGNEDVVRKVLAILGSEHPVVKKGGCFIVGISSMRLARGIARWGVTPAKARTLSWPSDLPVELEPHFLRGVFDADGWVGRDTAKPSVGISLVAPMFVEAVADRVERVCGQRPTVQRRKAKKVTHADSYRVVLYGDRAVQFGAWLWCDSTSEMRGNYKYERFALLSVQ